MLASGCVSQPPESETSCHLYSAYYSLEVKLLGMFRTPMESVLLSKVVGQFWSLRVENPVGGQQTGKFPGSAADR